MESVPASDYVSVPTSAYEPIQVAVKQIVNGYTVVTESGLVLAAVASKPRAESIAQEHRKVA